VQLLAFQRCPAPIGSRAPLAFAWLSQPCHGGIPCGTGVPLVLSFRPGTVASIQKVPGTD